jgi:hypothetical protein
VARDKPFQVGAIVLANTLPRLEVSIEQAAAKETDPENMGKRGLHAIRAVNKIRKDRRRLHVPK